MQQDSYQTIAGPAQGTLRDKGSRFIALAYPAGDEEAAKDIIGEVKKQFYDARHHCYAWVFGPDQGNYRFNDDGEPSGTAGRPIHGQIISAGLTDILVIVVRYFGGTKLGVRGLINAYKGATREALNQASVITRLVETDYEVLFDYSLMNDVMKLAKDFDLKQKNQDFDLNCRLTFSVRQQLSQQVLQAFENIRGLTIRRIQ
jgi:uncharacterized YigZ family protein